MVHKHTKYYIINTKYKQPGSFRNKRLAREVKRLIQDNGGLSEDQFNFYKLGRSLKVNLYSLYSYYKIPIPRVGEFSLSLYNVVWLDTAMFVIHKSTYEYD